ncbi:MAG: HAMP domain-containing protein [Agarilytica sp.]
MIEELTHNSPEQQDIVQESAPNKPGIRRVKAHRSLQQVLLVVVLFSIAFPALISGGILISENFKRTITYDSQVKAGSYVDLLQAGMRLPLWNISPSLGKPLMDAISVDHSVISIVVTTGESAFLQYSNIKAANDEDSITMTREITYEGDLLGEVTLIYSLKDAMKRAQDASRLLLTILTVQLVFSVALMGYFLRKRVTWPLLQLERSAAGIAEGDLETQIPKLGTDEFGVLSNQLERMRGALSRSIHELEERVRERTAELLDVNQELKGTLDKLRHAKDELVQQEKLAALGSLVAGIAHELNTPIGNGLTVATSMSESTENMKETLSSGMTRANLERYLADMDEGMHLVCLSLEKASELVSSFKQVAVDRTSAQRRSFDLSSLLNETRVTMATLMKHMPYKLEISQAEDVTIDGYPGPLGQVITNLLNNALLHGFDDLDHGTVKIITHPIAEGVQIIVEDNGRGIEGSNLSHIFDPFFTTKLGEGGNGLGLHIVHNIVTAVLGGAIEVTSLVGMGTRFIIKIPLVAPKEGSDALEEIEQERLRTGGAGPNTNDVDSDATNNNDTDSNEK